MIKGPQTQDTNLVIDCRQARDFIKFHGLILL